MTNRTIEIAKGKSATIVSPDQLAANVGAQHGVKIGDTMWVRREVKITDPDTKNSLGTVYLNRLRLKVTTLTETFSVGTVVEQAPSEGFAGLAVTRVKQMKTITAAPSSADSSTVHIEPGELVVITRVVDDADEDEEPDEA